MAGRRAVQILLGGLSLAVWACIDAGPAEDTTGTPEERALLESVATRVLAPSYEEFAKQADALAAATLAYADGGDEDARDAARDAWRETMAAWQVVELMQLGPAGASGIRLGGADLRDEVYSWPSVNACRVDQELVLGEYGAADFTDTRLVNAYGLDAVEYLLFWEELDNNCAPQLPINEDGEWDALSDEELVARRADYAAAAAADVAASAHELVGIWGSEGEWTEHLINAGQPGSEYGSVDEALDEVFAAMFYADKALKDLKLAKPGGLQDCAGETCPADLEFQWSQWSKEATAANAEGLSRLYFGGIDRDDAQGFDDLLQSVDEAELAIMLTDAVDDVRPTIEAVDGTFRDALATDSTALVAPHDAVKEVTDLLKGEFSIVLMLQIPKEGAGDAD